MMIEIRKLTESDMKQAVELRILCWTEELAGKAENVCAKRVEIATKKCYYQMLIGIA